MGMVCR